MSTCEHDRQDDVCWECKDERIAALEAKLALASEAMQKAAMTFEDLQRASAMLGRTLVAESCRIAKEATLDSLASLDAGKEAGK